MKRTIVNPVIKDTVTFLQTSAESGGKITAVEVTLSPGGSNPLHAHAYAEKFTAIEGPLHLRIGKKGQRVLQPGESCTAEPNAWHSFFNPTDREVRFGVQVEPGNQGLEYFLRIIYGLAADGFTDEHSKPKSIKHAAILICMADVKFPGFFTLMSPVLKFLAKRAKANGEEQRLIDRYCV
jgi:quercetin dioxygenase-like cupin family protein